MTLKEYFSAHGIKQYWFAEQLGIKPSILNRYASGRTLPPLDIALAIERETNGEVRPSDLIAPKREAS